MPAILYRIDGTARTFHDLFGQPTSAVYNTYGQSTSDPNDLPETIPTRNHNLPKRSLIKHPHSLIRHAAFPRLRR